MKPNHPARHPPREASPASGPTAFDWARESGEVDHVVSELDVFLARRRRRRRGTLAASVAVLALVTMSLDWWRHGEKPIDDAPATAVVLRPEIRTLPDGSIVELRAGAEIAIDFGGPGRRVDLLRGEAHFEVARDPQRPFVVSARGVEVRAVGTAFAVDLGARAVEVLVTHGQVAVENARSAIPEQAHPPARHPVFGAGQRVVVQLPAVAGDLAMPQAAALSAAELARRLAWRVPRLEFAGTPLSQAIAMFNAHGAVRLTLADPALGRLQLSGVLRADDIESLLLVLESEYGLTAERRNDELLLLRKP